MFIVEHWNGTTRLAEYIRDLEEHLESGIELLLLVIGRVIAVFADEKNSIDGKFVAAHCERVRGSPEDRHVEFLSAIAAYVLFRYLFGIHRHNLGMRVGRLLVM